MRCMIFVALALAAPAAAQDGLPDPTAVRIALDRHPAVQAGEARRRADEAQGRAMAAGPHEFTVNITGGRRNVTAGDTSFAEWQGGIERGIRLPGKAALDRAAALSLGEAAGERAADARHQTALLLHQLWWDWLGEAANARLQERAAGSMQQSALAVEKRHAAREAAAVELDQARAAASGAASKARATQGRANAARALLAAQFPDLPLPAEAPALPEPALPDQPVATLAELLLTHSHELGAAQADVKTSQHLAARARRDRFADPILGLRAFSEFGGAEKGVGVSMTLPLGGSHRRAVADQAMAQAATAEAELLAVRHQQQALASAYQAEIDLALAAWQEAQAAMQAAEKAAQRMAEGQRLGGVDLADRLYAERQALEAATAETAERVTALRLVSRLRIDSHTLWLDGDEPDPAHH